MTNEMNTNEAAKLGRKAFFSGAMRVPGWESALTVGGLFRADLAKAWLRGWDAACIEGMMADAN